MLQSGSRDPDEKIVLIWVWKSEPKALWRGGKGLSTHTFLWKTIYQRVTMKMPFGLNSTFDDAYPPQRSRVLLRDV